MRDLTRSIVAEMVGDGSLGIDDHHVPDTLRQVERRPNLEIFSFAARREDLDYGFGNGRKGFPGHRGFGAEHLRSGRLIKPSGNWI